MYYLSSALRARYLNRVLAPEGEDLSCRDKKGPKETLAPEWHDIPLTSSALSRWSGAPYGAQHLLRLTLVVFPPLGGAEPPAETTQGPKGRGMDSASPHPAHGGAVCGPSEAMAVVTAARRAVASGREWLW